MKCLSKDNYNKMFINIGKPVNSDKIISIIKNFDIISFDIFDTLLKRNVPEPTDVFLYMEKKLLIDNFSKRRVEAEKKARDENAQNEIKLDDIYDKFGMDFSKEEIEAESKLLIKNIDILPAFKWCVKNKTVILVSDMYLPRTFIESILKREGFVGYTDIYVSSETNKKKNDGEIFKLLIKKYGKERIIHIGDSIKSDYLIPKKMGIETIYIPNKIQRRYYSFQIGETIEEKIINSFINNTVDINENEYYKFGYEKFGMFLWGFSKWLHESLIKNNIHKVYFFSRDGFIMKRAFDIMYKDISTYYLEVSRRSLRVPILWMSSDFSNFINMISPSKMISLKMVFDGAGLDIKKYNNLIRKYNFDYDTVFDRNDIGKNTQLQALYSELKNDIDTKSKMEFEILVKYIKQMNLCGKFAIVDIGWSGGMQRYLEETLSFLDIKHKIKGFYIGIADYYKRNVEVIPDLDLNGYLFDFYHNKNSIDLRAPFVGLFETLFLEQNGSVENYVELNGDILAQRKHYEYIENGKPSYEYKCVKDIQRGALDFVNNFGICDLTIPANKLFLGISRIGLYPKISEVKLFGKFRFFDEGEIGYLAKPHSLVYYLFNFKNLKKDFLLSRWKIGFMKMLFKLRLPYYKMYLFMHKFFK